MRRDCRVQKRDQKPGDNDGRQESIGGHQRYFANCLISLRAALAPAPGPSKAVFQMVVDQLALGTTDGFFDGVELLRQVKARPMLLHHGNDGAQVPFGAFEPFQDRRMALMLHVVSYPRG